MPSKMLLILISFVFANGIFAQDGPIADTEYGQVQGTAIELNNGITVHSFNGIPYAEPPTGELRFLVSLLCKNYSS